MIHLTDKVFLGESKIGFLISDHTDNPHPKNKNIISHDNPVYKYTYPTANLKQQVIDKNSAGIYYLMENK